MNYIRFIAVSCLSLILTIYSAFAIANNQTNTLSTPYTDPSYLTDIPFGSHSHWIQPWRAYLETVPASTFLDGTGIQFNVEKPLDPELIARMLAKHGINRARVELNWGHLNFETEKPQRNPNLVNGFEANLLALKKYNLRPLILLNAHHGAPSPVKFFNRTVTSTARAGELQVELNDVSGLKVGYSGLSNLTTYWAAEALIVDISGNTVTLSKPLPENIEAGQSARVATLKYRPFSVPGSPDYEETMEGWKNYVGTVAKLAAEILGTTKSSDKGFDLEIWNELTFGSNFLYINKYYVNDPYEYSEKSIWRNLVEETADYVEHHSADFQGVQITNGFANTIPWPASSQQPARIDAISKHPYRNRNDYPQDESSGKGINAIGEKDSTIPTYSTLFPEYFGTAITTETLIRDMAPITSKVNGIDRGRYARDTNNPVPVWITEVNISPRWIDPDITPERALALKAKTTARYFCFYLNKGATQVYLYAATDTEDSGWNLVRQNFLDYAMQNTSYPTDDTAYTSLALATLSRIVAKMSEGLDLNLINTRPLEVVSISDTHDLYQFEGDGSKAHPHLYNRDVFAFLPFQVNAKRFVIPYYIMTRDIAKALEPEKFTVKIEGIKAVSSVTAYDPIENKDVSVKVKNKAKNSLTLEMIATDYPYLLTIQER